MAVYVDNWFSKDHHLIYSKRSLQIVWIGLRLYAKCVYHALRYSVKRLAFRWARRDTVTGHNMWDRVHFIAILEERMEITRICEVMNWQYQEEHLISVNVDRGQQCIYPQHLVYMIGKECHEIRKRDVQYTRWHVSSIDGKVCVKRR